MIIRIGHTIAIYGLEWTPQPIPWHKIMNSPLNVLSHIPWQYHSSDPSKQSSFPSHIFQFVTHFFWSLHKNESGESMYGLLSGQAWINSETAYQYKLLYIQMPTVTLHGHLDVEIINSTVIQQVSIYYSELRISIISAIISIIASKIKCELYMVL